MLGRLEFVAHHYLASYRFPTVRIHYCSFGAIVTLVDGQMHAVQDV